MKILKPLILLLINVFVQECYGGPGVTTIMKELEAGKTILENIDAACSSNPSIEDFVKNSGIFLTGVETVVKMNLGKIAGPKEPTDMQFLRELSKNIFQSFNDVDTQIVDIKKLVNRLSALSPYLTSILRIRQVSSAYLDLFTVPKSEIELHSTRFIMTYDNEYQESGTKLYQGFLRDRKPHGLNLLDSAMDVYANDKIKTGLLMAAIAKLLYIASQLELGYLAAVDQIRTDSTIVRRKWVNRFREIGKTISIVDKEVESMWKTQYRLDITESVRLNQKYDNSHISNNLYQALSKKYYWREWMVIVTDHVYDQYDRNQVCGGYAHTIYGKDVVVTSIPLDNSTIDEFSVFGMAQSLRQSYRDSGGNADLVYSWINPSVRESCTMYGAVGVIYGKKNAGFSAGTGPAGHCVNRHCRNSHYNCLPTGFERLIIYNVGGDDDFFAYFFG